MLLSELDLEAVLRSVVEAAGELTSAEYAALGVLNQDHTELERFIYLGIDDETKRSPRSSAPTDSISRKASIMAPALESRFPVGSSARTSRVRRSSARAIATDQLDLQASQLLLVLTLVEDSRLQGA